MFKDKKNIILAFLLFLLISISIGYASFSNARSNSKIAANINNKEDKDFCVKISDVKTEVKEGAEVVEKPVYKNLKADFKTKLANENDSVTYTINIINCGKKNAKIGDMFIREDGNEVIKPIILYAPTNQDILKPSKTTNVKISVQHNKNIEFKPNVKSFSTMIEYKNLDKEKDKK